jgi:hypothetical protein
VKNRMAQRVSDDHVEGSDWGERRLGRGCGCKGKAEVAEERGRWEEVLGREI